MKPTALALLFMLLIGAWFAVPGESAFAQEEEQEPRSYQLDVGGTTHTIFFEGITVCGKCLEIHPSPDTKQADELRGQVCTEQDQLEGKYFIPCGFCHIFVLVNTGVNFVLFELVPVVAVFLILLGGFFFFFSAGEPARVDMGKKILTGLVIGVALMYGAWLIVGLIFSGLGVAEWTGLGSWFEIECSLGEDFFGEQDSE